ncbi:MAG: phosphatase PAP2 family protein [Variovorax sp.]
MSFFRDLLWGVIEHIPFAFWHGLTWLGDSGLLLPAALSITFWLALSRRTWPVALQWIVLFGSASLVILVSKLAFMGWGVGIATLNFTGISGHTAISASVWPVVLWLMACRRSLRVQRAAMWAGWLLAAAIGVSRLALFAHSFSEVAAGYVLGVAVSATFLGLQRTNPRPHVRGMLVGVTLLLPLALLPPGRPAPTHDALEVIAMRLAGVDRVYTRGDLLLRL